MRHAKQLDNLKKWPKGVSGPHPLGGLHRGPDGLFWNLDHYLPLDKSLDDSDENIVLSCFTCNQKKGAKIMPPRI